jgi:hypothetical protein
MLVIKVELWPGGYEPRKKTISTCKIGNLSDLAETSDYEYRIEEPNAFGGEPTKQTGRVLKHKRRQSVWALIERVARSRMLLAELEQEETDGGHDVPTEQTSRDETGMPCCLSRQRERELGKEE